MGLILCVVLLLLVLGALPRPGAYSADWGYYPSGGLGLVLLVLVILLLLGHVPVYEPVWVAPVRHPLP